MPFGLVRTSETPVPPLDCLPTELLSDIFEWCLPDDASRRDAPLHRLAPWTLTWVCRQWRIVCLSNPKLWTRIKLGHYGSEPAGDEQILDLWLSRSSILPLHISLTHEMNDSLQSVVLNDDRKQAYLRGMLVVFNKVISVSHRWRVFKIHTLEPNALEPILSALVIGAPCIESMVVSTKYLGFFGDIRILDLSLCPNLRAVQLLCPKICPSPYQESPMASMQHLNLRFCTSVEDCLRWLDMCPILETMKVRLFSARPGFNELRYSRMQNIQRIRRLSKLRYFELHCFSVDPSPAVLLDLLELPNLKHLLVNMHDMSAYHEWSHAFDLIQRSKASLEVLELWGATATRNVFDCLRCSPRLHTLSLGRSMTVDDILSNLKVRSNPQFLDDTQASLVAETKDDILCPNLEVVNLSDSSWSLDVLVDMVTSRCTRPCNIQQKESSRCRALRRLGLDATALPSVLNHMDIGVCTEKGLSIGVVDGQLFTSILASPRLNFDEPLFDEP